MKRTALITATLLTGCATTQMAAFDQTIQSYVGRTSADVVSRIGAPTSTYDDPAGFRVLTYAHAHEIDLGPAYGRHRYTCELQFTTTEDGKITRADYRSDYATCDKVYGARLTRQQ